MNFTNNYCGKCGAKNELGRSLCTNCGAPLTTKTQQNVSSDQSTEATATSYQYQQQTQTNINVNQQPSATNARIGLLMALLGLFFGGVFAIVGLFFAYKGKKLGEEKDKVLVSLTANWAVLFIYISIIIICIILFA